MSTRTIQNYFRGLTGSPPQGARVDIMMAGPVLSSTFNSVADVPITSLVVGQGIDANTGLWTATVYDTPTTGQLVRVIESVNGAEIPGRINDYNVPAGATNLDLSVTAPSVPVAPYTTSLTDLSHRLDPNSPYYGHPNYDTAIAALQSTSSLSSLLFADAYPDCMVKGMLVPTSATLQGAIPASSHYYQGGLQQVPSAAAQAIYTYAASSDTYEDWGANGAVSRNAVANGAAAPALGAGLLRVSKVVTSGTAITGVYQLCQSLAALLETPLLSAATGGANYWVPVATLNLNAQGSVSACRATLTIPNKAGGDGATAGCMLTASQTGAMGTAPNVQLLMTMDNGFAAATNLVAVTTVNTVSMTQVVLYAKVPTSGDQILAAVLASTGAVQVVSGGTGVAALPAGAQATSTLATTATNLADLKVTAGAGLTVNYAAGIVAVAGVPTAITAGSLTLPASQTCYVYVNALGAVTYTTATQGFAVDGLSEPLATVVTGTSTVTTVTDQRAWLGTSGYTTADAVRLKDQVATQADVRISSGVERISMKGDLTGGLWVPRDQRIALSGPWIPYTSVSPAHDGFAIPGANALVPDTGSIWRVNTNVAGSTITVTWYGTALLMLVNKNPQSGQFTVVTDGGTASTITAGGNGDTYTSTWQTCVPVNVTTNSSGAFVSSIAAAWHTTVITVANTKNASASDYQIAVFGFDALETADGSAAYQTGKAFPSGVPTQVTVAGTISAPASIGSAPYQKGVYTIAPGATAPVLTMAAAGSTGDTLAQFQAKNKVAFRVEAEDQTGRLANIWATAIQYANNVNFSGGSYVNIGTSSTQNDTSSTDYLIIGFVGTGLDVLFVSGSSSGQCGVSIDGGSETTYDTYSNEGSAIQQRTNVAKNLPWGYHQVKIRKLGTHSAGSGYYVSLDAFDVYHACAPGETAYSGAVVSGLPANSQVLGYDHLTPAATDANAGNAVLTPTSPSSGWIRHPNQSEFVYGGSNWSTPGNAAHTGGSCYLNTNTNTTDTLTFGFFGSQFRILCGVNTDRGEFNVSIDGGANTLVSCYNASLVVPAVVYTSASLTAGYHTVTITMANAKSVPSTNNQILFDSIEVLPVPSQIRDVRNFYAQDQTPITQAINDHFNGIHHPTNTASQMFNNASTANTSGASPTLLNNGGTLGTIVTKGNPILVIAAGVASNNTAGSSTFLLAGVDGVMSGPSGQMLSTSANYNGTIYAMTLAIVPPGTHTFGAYGYVNGGIGTYSNGTVYAVEL